MSQTNNEASSPALTPFFDLLSKSWKLYCRGFVSFVEMYLWALIGLIPLFILLLLALFLAPFLSPIPFYLYVVFGFLSLFAVAWAIYYGTRAEIGIILLLKNNFSKVKDNFLESKKFFWRYILLSITYTLMLIVLFLLLIVPGVVAYVFFSLSYLVLVIEDKRVFSSLERSADLVKGKWWKVFGRFLGLLVIGLLISAILSLPVNHLSDLAAPVYSVVSNIIWVLITPFFTIFFYHIYKDLSRSHK